MNKESIRAKVADVDTYPEMNEKIKGYFMIDSKPLNLYVIARIIELEDTVELQKQDIEQYREFIGNCRFADQGGLPLLKDDANKLLKGVPIP